MSNCCLIDFKNMFENGFKLGNAQVDSPKSIQTATAQASQIIANVASSQYGGCSFDRADEILAPYAKLNYAKHLKDAEEWIEQPEKREAYAQAKTKKISMMRCNLWNMKSIRFYFKWANTFCYSWFWFRRRLVCT